MYTFSLVLLLAAPGQVGAEATDVALRFSLASVFSSSA